MNTKPTDHHGHAVKGQFLGNSHKNQSTRCKNWTLNACMSSLLRDSSTLEYTKERGVMSCSLWRGVWLALVYLGHTSQASFIKIVPHPLASIPREYLSRPLAVCQTRSLPLKPKHQENLTDLFCRMTKIIVQSVPTGYPRDGSQP